jgi:hypothetical protein
MNEVLTSGRTEAGPTPSVLLGQPLGAELEAIPWFLVWHWGHRALVVSARGEFMVLPPAGRRFAA